MVAVIDRLLRRTPPAQPISHALVNHHGDWIPSDTPPAFRSVLERDFRALQGGASGVSDYALNNLALTVVVVYTCLEFLANKARMVPLKVDTRAGETEGPGPFVHFLHNQAAGILSDCTRALSLWGKAFVRKQYNTAGYPTGLVFINPNNISQRVDRQTGEILGYRLPRTHEELRADEVIYLSRFSYAGDGNPLSPTEAAFINGGIQQGIASYAVGFFFNDAVPAGIVSFDPPLTAPQYDLAKRQWRQEFRGAARAHKINFTNGTIHFTPVSQALKDLAMQPLDDGSKQKICAAYLINPAAVGLGDVSQGLHSRSTFEDAVTETLQTAVLPVVRLICEGLTEQWAQADFSPPHFYRMVPDTGAMPELSAITSDRVTTSIDILEAGTWDYAEQRAYLGLPAREDSDDRLFFQAHTRQPLDMFNDGTCSLKEFRRMVGLPAPIVDYWKVGGKSVATAQIAQYIEENSLVSEPESPFGLLAEAPVSPVLNNSIYADALADVLALPEPERITAPARTQMQGLLAVDFGGHTLVKMARRALGKVLDSDYAVSWVPDDHWRLDLLQLEQPTPEKTLTLMQQTTLGQYERMECWSSGFQVVSESVYLTLILPDTVRQFQEAVSGRIDDTVALDSTALPIAGIKLCDMPGVTASMVARHDLVDFPVVVDNLSLYIDGQKRHTWILERVTEEQRKELRNWQFKVTRSSHPPADVPFTVGVLPEHVAVYVREALAADSPVLADIFQEARKRLSQRAIQATRVEYELAVEALLIDQQAGKVTRRRFGTLLRALNNRYGAMAYRDGLIDGGVLDGEPDDDDQKTIKALVKQSNSFVTGFADRLFAGNVTETELAEKPTAWYRGAIAPLYQAGMLSADANGMYRFDGPDGAQSCKDCQRLKGQVHRLKAWDRRGLNLVGGAFIGQNTECGGSNCQHGLFPTSARAKGNF